MILCLYIFIDTHTHILHIYDTYIDEYLCLYIFIYTHTYITYTCYIYRWIFINNYVELYNRFFFLYRQYIQYYIYKKFVNCKKMKKKTLTQVPLEVSVHLRYLYQDKGIRGKKILKIYPKLSKATIYRHHKKPLADKTLDKLKHNHGRPRRISPSDKHLILHQIHILREQYGSFTIKRSRVRAEVKKDVSDETVRHVLHGAGYRFLHFRKKGLLKKHDLKKRHKFAQKVAKMLTNKF